MLPLLPLLLLAVQDPEREVLVTGPGRPNAQTPATLVVEPAAMFVVACDADGDARTTRPELDLCVDRSVAAIDPAPDAALGYLAFARWQVRWLGDQGALPSPFEVDRNGDDRITVGELRAQFAKLFSRFDKDGDRAVTRAEALTVRATAADAQGPVDSRRGKDRKKGPPPHPKAEPIPGGTPDPS